MIRKSVLLTLAWRWRTIGCLPLWAFAFAALAAVFEIVGGILNLTWEHIAGSRLPRWADHPSGIGWNSGAWVAGLSLGFVIAWTVHELLRCPTSATMPRLRRRLGYEVVTLLAISSVTLVWLWDDRVSPADRAVSMAIVFAGGSTGVFVAHPDRFRSLPSAMGLIVGLFAPARLLEGASRPLVAHAAVSIGALVVLGIVAVCLAFSADEHRRLLATISGRTDARPNPAGLDMSHRDRQDRSRWAPIWLGGRDWARATLHELHGAGPFGWRMLNAYYFVLLVGMLVTIPGNHLRIGRSPWGWSSIASNALGEDPVSWRSIATIWILFVSVWAATAPCVPRVGIVRPASRAERARAAWRVCALRAGPVLGGGAILALALGAFASWRSAALGESPAPARGLPDLLAAFLILAILFPWAAWIRLRLLDLSAAHGRFPSPLRQGFVATLIVGGCLFFGHVLGSGWVAAEDVGPALAPLLFAPAVVASWLAYRVVLVRLFQTIALPV